MTDTARPATERGHPGFTGVRAFRRIDDVDATTWDALVPPDELQMRHGFVRACRDADVESAEYRHLLVFRDGNLLGIASVFRMDVRLELLCPGFLRSLVLAVRRLYPSFLRPTLLLCGLPVSAGRPCLAFRSSEDAAFVVGKVAEFMESLAEEMGARVLGFKEFDPVEALVVETLRDHGYFRAHSLPTLRMTLRWPSFEAYVADMRSGYRRQLRATLRAGRVAGLRCRVSADPLSDCARFFPLYEQVMDRARYQLERLNLQFFQNLLRNFSGSSRLLLLERGDELLAAAVMLESPGLSTFFMTGLDYAGRREWQVYENLVTEVVADAIAAGGPLLQMGQTSVELKGRLGGVPEERYIFLRCRTRWAHALLRLAAPLLFPRTRVPPRHVFHAGSPSAGGPRQGAGSPASGQLEAPAAAIRGS